MNAFLAEFTGSALLITLGDGVVANVLLSRTKGNNGGLVAITLGWMVAVFVGVYVSAAASGAHLNPAVTVALAVRGKFAWALVPGYFTAQVAGCMTGAFLVWLCYRQHFEDTRDPDLILACFATGPAIRNPAQNFITECVATFIFLLGVLFIGKPAGSLGSLDALPVSLLVLGIGLSLGGPTGYAINPARDLGPRIMHGLLPIPHKGSGDWRYAWIPVAAPIAGAVLAAWLYGAMNP